MIRTWRLLASVAILGGSLALLVAPASAAQLPTPDANGAYVHCNMTVTTNWTPGGVSFRLACQSSETPTGSFSLGASVNQWCGNSAMTVNCVSGSMGLGGATGTVTGTGRFQVTVINAGFDNSPQNYIPSVASGWHVAESGFTSFSGSCYNCVVVDSFVIGSSDMPLYPTDYYAGGSPGGAPPPPPPQDCVIGNVVANWPSTGPQMSTNYQVTVGYTGQADVLTIIYGDKRAPQVLNPAPASPYSFSLYWDAVGAYTAEIDCTTTASGHVAKWAIPVNVTQQSKALSDCLPDSLGAVLDPGAWVKSMGCVLEWAFVPSDATKAQMSSLWGTAQTKAPFSFVIDVATFLPNSANQLAQGITDRDRGNIIGDRSCATFIDGHPLSGTPGLGSGPGVDNCIDSQLTHNGLSPWAATIRTIILFLVLLTLALGVWRMTTKTIG